MLKWILIILGTVCGYILVRLGLIFAKIKKDTTQSKLKIQKNLKKKDNITSKLIAILNNNDEKVSVYTIELYQKEKDIWDKIEFGKELSTSILNAIKKEYRLQMDADIGIMIDSLRIIDAELDELKEIYKNAEKKQNEIKEGKLLNHLFNKVEE
jgi:hypothetical protein